MSVPDANIFPHATGLASETVNKHSAPQELVFYSGWFCPFVQRVWIALEEKKIPYQYKEVNPYLKEPDFLKISPKGLVPAIGIQGKPLPESNIINEYLEDAYPNTKPLLPKDPYKRSRVRLAIDNIGKQFVPAYFRLLIAQDEQGQEKARQDVERALKSFAAEIEGPFFTGNDLSLADIALIPWMVRGHIIEEHRGFDFARIGPKFDVWKNSVLDLQSVKNTISEREKYIPIYNRYLKDEAQSEAAKATRLGKAIP